MISKKNILILTSFLFFTGCGATGPIYENAPKAPVADANTSVLHIYRTGPFLFGADIKLNDELLLSLPKNSYTWVSLEPGIHHFEVNASAGAPTVHFEENIEAAKEYYIHVYVSGMEVSAGLKKKILAMAYIESLKYEKPLITTKITAKSK